MEYRIPATRRHRRQQLGDTAAEGGGVDVAEPEPFKLLAQADDLVHNAPGLNEAVLVYILGA
jgi:hypothetical protein